MNTLNRSLFIAATAAAITVGGAAISSAAAESTSKFVPEIEWDTTLKSFQFDSDKFIGQRFSAKCLPGTGRETGDGVYGTDVYPSNNSICLAALHAGKIDTSGGVVTVQLNPGADRYTGSRRNGITTADLPGTRRSMVFVDAVSSIEADQILLSYLPRLKWDTKFTATGFAHKRLTGQRFTFACPAAPANLRPRRVVGTDAYAFHSMVCRAAVHAGRISMDGGIVSVQLDPGKDRLVGSIRNGIESKDGPGGHQTLSFVDSPVQQP